MAIVARDALRIARAQPGQLGERRMYHRWDAFARVGAARCTGDLLHALPVDLGVEDYGTSTPLSVHEPEATLSLLEDLLAIGLLPARDLLAAAPTRPSLAPGTSAAVRTAEQVIAGTAYTGGRCLLQHAVQPLGRRSIRRRFPGACDGIAGNRRRVCASRRTGYGPPFRARLSVLAVPADVGARLAAIRYQQGQRERDAAHGALGYLQRPEPVALRGRWRFSQRESRTDRKLLRSHFQGHRHN